MRINRLRMKSINKVKAIDYIWGSVSTSGSTKRAWSYSSVKADSNTEVRWGASWSTVLVGYLTDLLVCWGTFGFLSCSFEFSPINILSDTNGTGNAEVSCASTFGTVWFSWVLSVAALSLTCVQVCLVRDLFYGLSLWNEGTSAISLQVCSTTWSWECSTASVKNTFWEVNWNTFWDAF